MTEDTDMITEVQAGSRHWHVIHARNLAVGRGLPALPDMSVDHAILDPPYSAWVHGGRTRTNKGGAGTVVDLGFRPLSAVVRNAVAAQLARVVRRWCVVFSDSEGAHLWIAALEAAGMRYVRWGQWHRIGSTPQMTGDRPAAASEALIIAHGPERIRWNGGGRAAYWESMLAGRKGGEQRTHTAQKPLDLMQALVRDFTDRGDLIIDPFSGSGTTGEAAVRLGRRALLWEKRKGDVRRTIKRLSGVLVQLDLEGEHPIFTPPPAAAKPQQIGLGLALDAPPPARPAEDA